MFISRSQRVWQGWVITHGSRCQRLWLNLPPLWTPEESWTLKVESHVKNASCSRSRRNAQKERDWALSRKNKNTRQIQIFSPLVLVSKCDWKQSSFLKSLYLALPRSRVGFFVFALCFFILFTGSFKAFFFFNKLQLNVISAIAIRTSTKTNQLSIRRENENMKVEIAQNEPGLFSCNFKGAGIREQTWAQGKKTRKKRGFSCFFLVISHAWFCSFTSRTPSSLCATNYVLDCCFFPLLFSFFSKRESEYRWN